VRRVGERVRELREHRGLTQHELAARALMSRASVANVEAGRQNVALRRLCSLAGALGVTPADLFAEVRPRPDE
jgi:UDP-N-acetylglucosamine 1-carboxyvinyltransferase